MYDVEQVPPSTARPLPSNRRAAIHDLLVDEVGGRNRWWQRMGRGATVGVGAGALVLAGGAASATYVALKPASDVYSVNCYSAATTDNDKSTRVAVGDRVTKSERAAGETESEPVKINDPVAVCAQLWEQGVITPSSDELDDPAPPGSQNSQQVPRLTACTLKEGTAGVFPGDDSVCDDLNLPHLG